MPGTAMGYMSRWRAASLLAQTFITLRSLNNRGVCLVRDSVWVPTVVFAYGEFRPRIVSSWAVHFPRLSATLS